MNNILNFLEKLGASARSSLSGLGSCTRLFFLTIIYSSDSFKRFNLTILRLCGVYGKGDASKSTINRLVSSAIDDRRINITCNPNIERDYILVNDISRIIENIVENKIIGIFNIATGKSQTISGISKNIVSKLNFKVDITVQNKIADNRVIKQQFDTSFLAQNFKSLEMTSLNDGLADYINNYFTQEVKNNNED